MKRILLLPIAFLVLFGCRPKASPVVFVDPALAVLVPADTVMLAGVRMQRLAETPFYERFVASRKLTFVEEFRKRTGLDLTKDLWELLVASDGLNTVVLVRGKFSAMGLEPKLEREGTQRLMYKGYTMLGDEQDAVVFLNPTTAVAGRTPAVKRLVDNRNETSGLPSELEARVRTVPSTNQAWFVANVSGRLPDIGDRDMGNWTGLLRLVQTIQFATGGLDARQAFRTTVRLEAGNEREAEQLRDALRGLIGLGRLSTGEGNREAMLAIYDGMQVVRQGSITQLSTDIPFTALETAVAQLHAPGDK